MSDLADQLRRIATTRTYSSGRSKSCVALMKEYLRREMHIAECLGFVSELPFADLAYGIDPAIRCTEEELMFIDEFTVSSVEARACRHLMNWDKVINALGRSNAVLLMPDPYEVLIRFFRRGGSFTREHGIFVEVNHNYGLHAGMAARASELNIDDSSLDRLDSDEG